MGPQSPSNKVRVRKTKTFTGCWTCRRRKVKCDTNEPKCDRCIKAGISCDGYGIQLCWVHPSEDLASSVPAVNPRAMLLRDRLIPTTCDVEEVNSMLSALEKQTAGVANTSSVGSFSVFQAVDGQVLQHASGHKILPMSDSDKIIDPRRGTRSPLHLEIRSALYNNRSTNELMHNYMHNIADLLQPMHHPRNPYRSIYIPNALIGSSSMLTGVGSSTKEIPNSNIAIFHSLLATSAFHLRGLKDEQTRGELENLGRFHKAKAFEALQMALHNTQDVPGYFTTVSVMLSFSTIDASKVMEGSMTEYWIHIDGCEQFRRSRGRMHELGTKQQQLNAVFAFMATLASSTRHDAPPLPWPAVENESEIEVILASPFEAGDHCLEFTYGATSSLATLLNLTTKLARHVLYYDLTGSMRPESLQYACNKLDEAITAWHLSSETFPSIPSEDCDTLILAQYHATAFHSAIKIYFHTRIQRCSSETLAYYSRSAAEYLLATEAFKSTSSTHYGVKLMAPIAWPGFIAACEASVEERSLWSEWWIEILKYRIGNLSVMWRIVQEVWEARDSGLEEVPGWLPILKRSGQRVMAM